MTVAPDDLRAAGVRVRRHEDALDRAVADLRQLAAAGLAEGMTLRQVAHLTGLSHQRIDRMTKP